jgi:hypothetical protein
MFPIVPNGLGGGGMRRLSLLSFCCLSAAGSASRSLCERALLSFLPVSGCTFRSAISRLLSLRWELSRLVYIGSKACVSERRRPNTVNPEGLVQNGYVVGKEDHTSSNIKYRYRRDDTLVYSRSEYSRPRAM